VEDDPAVGSDNWEKVVWESCVADWRAAVGKRRAGTKVVHICSWSGPCNMLHRQPSSKDRARKSWEAILGLRYFGPAKVVQISWRKPRKSGSRSRGLRGARGAVLGTLWRCFWHLLSRKWALSCRITINLVYRYRKDLASNLAGIVISRRGGKHAEASSSLICFWG
jgi:hypothetical protein